MPRISSFPDFVLLFVRSSVRRCAPKLRRQKTSVRFDSIEGTRPGFFVPFGALPSYNDCIMTIAVSIFICGSAKSSRSQHARASLLISCLPIFLLFIFARSSGTPRAESHASLMHSLHFCAPRLLSISLCKPCEFMTARFIEKVDSVFESFRNPQIITQIKNTSSFILIFIRIRSRSTIVYHKVLGEGESLKSLYRATVL